jgi:hypothetical protein
MKNFTPNDANNGTINVSYARLDELCEIGSGIFHRLDANLVGSPLQPSSWLHIAQAEGLANLRSTATTCATLGTVDGTLTLAYNPGAAAINPTQTAVNMFIAMVAYCAEGTEIEALPIDEKAVIMLYLGASFYGMEQWQELRKPSTD